MAKDRSAAEQDASDGSVEEISGEDFKPRSRGWSGSVYPQMLSRNYASNYTSNLYNFAWAQAVQNKPLGFGASRAAEAEEEEVVYEVPDGSDGEGGKGDNGEREEGELEEGEIDLDAMEAGGTGEVTSENVEEEKKGEVVGTAVCDDDATSVGTAEGEEEATFGDEEEEEDNEDVEESEEIEDFDQQVILILEEIETVTEEDAEKSFEEACSRLQRALDGLRKLVLRGSGPVLEAVIQQAFAGIQAIHSAFLKSKEPNKKAFTRFISRIGRKVRALFEPEQIKEIDTMIQTLTSHTKYRMKDEKLSLESKVCLIDGHSKYDDTFLNKPSRLEQIVIPKSHVSPLLDPHANIDEGSLPSPTRGSAPPFFGASAVRSGHEFAVSQPSLRKQEDPKNSTLLPYVTDAFKAVSSYQKKYDRISFLSSNRLPSPTPSEEKNDDNDDSFSEVSSSSLGKARVLTSPISSQSTGSNSGSIYTNGATISDTGTGKTVNQLASVSKPLAKASAKSRDPRLKFVNSAVARTCDFNNQSVLPELNEMKNVSKEKISTDPRKHKIVNATANYCHPSKRPRNDLPSSQELSSGRGGWLDDSGVASSLPINKNYMIGNEKIEYGKSENGDVVSRPKQDISTNLKGPSDGSEQVHALGSNAIDSLPSLLKDIVVNPTMLMQLLKEQQRLAIEAQQKDIILSPEATQGLSMKRPAGGVPFQECIAVKTSAPDLQVHGKNMPLSQPATNEAGRIRMKPRDPRRVLHNNMNMKNEGVGAEHLKVVGPTSSLQISKDCIRVREVGEQAETSGVPLRSPPDIASQVDKRIINFTNIESTQSASIPPIASQSQNETSDAGASPVRKDFNGAQILSPLSSDANLTASSIAGDPWGDVNHLLDGYDDQQKFLIQKERARRIGEQSKMFAARKLCLVLDLDHTLLNSAKFAEVEPAHDEILKKKEEQDLERSQRHLFRFQHMGMWTKLRPGIWNFLEKASKLYELHLYTMGNNLYATEMAKVLDPTGTLFAGRVISKGDDSDLFDGNERLPKNKDLEGVLGMESAVVIIDDSIRVWPHHKLNLIVVERYTYFPVSRRQFGLPGPSLLEIDHDERPEDGTLASSLAVIERIHQNFFSHLSLDNVDVRNILATEQRSILGGCRIVFSRIFPVGFTNPHLHPLWQMAEQFGASCTNQIDDQVTHVVANSLGTDKVNWALSTGRFVVYPGWVEASALLYRRANELEFGIKI